MILFKEMFLCGYLVRSLFALAGLENRRSEVAIGFSEVVVGLLVQPALMWGGNSSIDPGVSFSGGQWWCIVLVSPALPFYFLSASEFVWSCGKCGWCLLTGLRLGFSMWSPGRSYHPWSWVKCKCYEVVLSLGLQPMGSSGLLGKGLWSLCSIA
ncbi:hypothetical protein F2Q70_00029098 [Brassica cretica]|uniref:Cation/H+ exchanger domain-containing protein n=1 Tax=Brassica cretica TaxID=69181 RepID=A0A8S9FD48_BRACR|nr:hypothetical protein F2Q70_00029098 [Brassica cretica]KAF2552535.1 hypothetical protein F2Q68_00033477 [Brassica cretica]